MARTDQKGISSRRREYNKIREIKELYELDIGKKIDWSEFFFTLGLAYLVGRGLRKQEKRYH